MQSPTGTWCAASACNTQLKTENGLIPKCLRARAKQLLGSKAVVAETLSSKFRPAGKIQRAILLGYEIGLTRAGRSSHKSLQTFHGCLGPALGGVTEVQMQQSLMVPGTCVTDTESSSGGHHGSHSSPTVLAPSAPPRATHGIAKCTGRQALWKPLKH